MHHDDEMRIRNHYHFRALSGDILLDQGIHMLDVCNWALKCASDCMQWAMAVQKGVPDFGDAWSNFQVLYQYPNDINVSVHSQKQVVQLWRCMCKFIGTKGYAEAHYSGGVFINGDNAWDSGIAKTDTELTPQQQASGVFNSSLHDSDANKEKAFIDSIVSGNYLNQAKLGATSTLTAILGREAATARQGKNMG